jgi:hypothetical protein
MGFIDVEELVNGLTSGGLTNFGNMENIASGFGFGGFGEFEEILNYFSSMSGLQIDELKNLLQGVDVPLLGEIMSLAQNSNVSPEFIQNLSTQISELDPALKDKVIDVMNKISLSPDLINKVLGR